MPGPDPSVTEGTLRGSETVGTWMEFSRPGVVSIFSVSAPTCVLEHQENLSTFWISPNSITTWDRRERIGFQAQIAKTPNATGLKMSNLLFYSRESSKLGQFPSWLIQ